MARLIRPERSYVITSSTPGRQARLQFLEAGLDARRGFQRIVAVAHDHDTAGDLPLAVELGHPPPRLRSGLDVRHVLQPDGHALGIRTQGNRAGNRPAF